MSTAFSELGVLPGFQLNGYAKPGKIED